MSGESIALPETSDALRDRVIKPSASSRPGLLSGTAKVQTVSPLERVRD